MHAFHRAALVYIHERTIVNAPKWVISAIQALGKPCRSRGGTGTSVVWRKAEEDSGRLHIWRDGIFAGRRAVGVANDGGREEGRGNSAPLQRRSALGRQGMKGGAASDYGERGFKQRILAAIDASEFLRNLPRTGSAMSSRTLPNSASVSRQNRCR
jgi:hypothetical protein